VSDFTIRVTGLKEAQQALYAYSQQMGDRVVVAALKAGAKVMQRQARANAPKVTGRLRRGIVVGKSKIITGRKTPGKLGVYLTYRTTKKTKTGIAGRKNPNDAFYGRILEGEWTDRGGNKHAGLEIMERAFNTTAEASAQVIVRSAIAGSEIVARRTGLK